MWAVLNLLDDWICFCVWVVTELDYEYKAVDLLKGEQYKPGNILYYFL